MTTKDRYREILHWFSTNRPDAASELDYDSAYQLLVAVILSAQCTDKRVNLVTPAFFKTFPTPADLAAASREDVYELVKSVTYPNSKTDHLIAAAKMLVKDFNGEVPASIDELRKLPGVGRKTANVVASICYQAPVIAVDTHVFRVAHRLGLSSGKTPDKVEDDLSRNIPSSLRAKAHHWIILHGRYVCTAKHPFCSECGLREWCKGYKEIRYNEIRKNK